MGKSSRNRDKRSLRSQIKPKEAKEYLKKLKEIKIKKKYEKKEKLKDFFSCESISASGKPILAFLPFENHLVFPTTCTFITLLEHFW